MADDYDDGLEEAWILEKKSESSTSGLFATPPRSSPWRLPAPSPVERRRSRLSGKLSRSQFPREYLVGFRGWKIRADKLCPVAVGEPWPYCEPLHAVHVNTAFAQKRHEAPAKGCMCGTWAFRFADEAVLRFRQYASEAQLAMGAVALWGRVFEHRFGWRAEWAYPLSLELYGCSDDTAALLAEMYAVPVTHIVRKGEHPDDLRRKREAELRQSFHAKGCLLPGDVDPINWQQGYGNF